MSKKRKFDFVLHEDNDEITIFRFYPRQSSCHSFNTKPPTKPEEIYKVYYSYSVFRRWKEDNEVEILFECPFDECSVIDEVAERLKYLSEDKKEVIVTNNDDTWTVKCLDNEIYDFADCVYWTISEWWNGDYRFNLFKTNGIGYRFWLPKEKAYKFGKYLEECCEYMLAHGNPI